MLATATRPQYCPRCHKQCPIADLDYADTLCMDNAALTRQQALDAINHVNTINSHAKSTRSYRYVEDYLSKDLGLARLPSLRTLTTPLQVSCRDCGGSYVFYRNAPDIQRTPPLYCVWCASSHTIVLPFSTDDTSLIVLAQVYNLPLQLTQTLYDLWSTRSSLSTFKAFVESPDVAKVIARYIEEVAVNG
jgi:hypothetical protein